MTVLEIIELLEGYKAQRLPLSLPSLINTLEIHNITYTYHSEMVEAGKYYTGCMSDIRIYYGSGAYDIVIMNDKVVNIEYCRLSYINILSPNLLKKY